MTEFPGVTTVYSPDIDTTTTRRGPIRQPGRDGPGRGPWKTSHLERRTVTAVPIDNDVYDRIGVGWWDESNPLNLLQGSLTPAP